MKQKANVIIRIVKSIHGTLYIYFINRVSARDELRSLGFTFDPEMRSWYKVVVNSERHVELLQKLRSFLTFSYPVIENGKYPEFLNIVKSIKEKYSIREPEIIGYWCKNNLEDNFLMMLKNFYYDFFNDCFFTKPMLLHPVIKIKKLPTSNILSFSYFVNESGAVLQTNNRSVQYAISDIDELNDSRVLFLHEIPGWHKSDVNVIRYIVKYEPTAFPVCLDSFYDRQERRCKRFEGIVFFSQ